MTTPAVDRLELGPLRRTRSTLPRRIARGAAAGLASVLVLLGVSLATASGWRPPVPVAAPVAVPLPVVEPWQRHLPYAFVDRVDTVTGTGLPARVVRPRGAEGTIPGVVLVAGAGTTTRDDLADEAEALARGGLAVLTYDKRREGYGPLRRDYARLADDALGALTTVGRQAGVDRERLGLLGFSEGGWVVPLAAAKDRARVAFVVLVSAPVVSPLDQASWVVDRRLVGLPDPVRAGAAAVLTLGRPVTTYLGTDVRAELAAAPQPVYAVWGASDGTVPVAVAVDRFRQATGERGRVEVAPGTGHRVPVGTGWAERVSDWVRRGYPADDEVRGVAPDDLVGLPTLPRVGPWSDPRLHLALSALVALVVASRPVRRTRLSSARSG